MNLYQITKYNPKYRDFNGKYLLSEWTSIHDIDRIYSGKIFSANEYILIENAYIKAIEIVLEYYNIETMKVNGLEKYKDINDFNDILLRYPQYYPDNLILIFKSVTEDSILKKEDALAICRLNLREHLWCNLHSLDYNLKLNFGYDYYMKIECKELNEKLICDIESLGLFVE